MTRENEIEVEDLSRGGQMGRTAQTGLKYETVCPVWARHSPTGVPCLGHPLAQWASTTWNAQCRAQRGTAGMATAAEEIKHDKAVARRGEVEVRRRWPGQRQGERDRGGRAKEMAWLDRA